MHYVHSRDNYFVKPHSIYSMYRIDMVLYSYLQNSFMNNLSTVLFTPLLNNQKQDL